MSDLYPFIDKLKETVAISAVLSRYVKLKRQGHEFIGLCPFHNEKTPSFTVNDHKGFYYCFGCGASGDAVRFLVDHQKLPFLEAVKQLASIAGMALPKFESRYEHEGTTRLYKLLDEAATFFQNTLAKTKFAKEYLEKRDLSDSIISTYRLGFSTNAVVSHLQKQGYSLQEVAAAGVSVAPDKAISRFRDRLIFPICDGQGRVIAFGGRAMGEDPPKYLNGPETSLFHKSVHLYGIHHVKGVTLDNPLVVVEGYIDVIRAQSSGLNAVAPLGTALTTDHIQRLWRMDKEPILCFDGDLAGEKAMLRAAYRALPLLKPGYSLRFCALPAGHDPDSFIRDKSAESFQSLIKQALPIAEVLFAFYDKQVSRGTPEQKAKIKTDLFKELEGITDPHIKSFYKDSFYKRQRAKTSSQAPVARLVGSSSTSSKWSRELCEKILLVTLMNHPTLISVMAEQLAGREWLLQGAQVFVDTLLEDLQSSDDLVVSNEVLQRHATFIKMLEIDEMGALAPFSRKDANKEDAEQGFLSVFHSIFTKRQLVQTLADVKEKLAQQFDTQTWQMFRQLKRELQSF